jgi:hypothetical protein
VDFAPSDDIPVNVVDSVSVLCVFGLSTKEAIESFAGNGAIGSFRDLVRMVEVADEVWVVVTG